VRTNDTMSRLLWRTSRLTGYSTHRRLKI